MEPLREGIYDQLIDENIRQALEANPELRSIVKKIDAEESPARFAAFLADVIEKALKNQDSPAVRREICNQIISQLANDEPSNHLKTHELSQWKEKDVLTEITPSNFGTNHFPRPATPIWESSLFTGSVNDPRLDHELVQEIHSADRIDFLVAFIRFSGLRLLLPALDEASKRNVPIRVITTSYMGASEARAIERLAAYRNVEVRVSYDTDRTRLHAKAYHFHRDSGFSTAYIGSANVSEPALTSGLEWNLKVTRQDLPHIIEKFLAEFETYWNSPEFIPFDPDHPERFRIAIKTAKSRSEGNPIAFFAEMRPHSFQERILEAIELDRQQGHFKNLIVAATGTGKTVISAFDYERFHRNATKTGKSHRLLFIAHRQEILEQSLGCFRAVLRDQNFGELQVGPHQAATFDHLFCSNLGIKNLKLWEKLGADYFDFIIVDEAHHGTAESYRAVFENFSPTILLGLTATPERMDGNDIRADFGGRFAAEIRLPDALSEKLLCPFQYFAVSDPVSLADSRFWRSGKYETKALENVYTAHDVIAKQRVEAVLSALDKYHGDIQQARALGFCASVKHAEYMADCFEKSGIPSRALSGETESKERQQTVREFRSGDFPVLFVVDLFNEGVDIPEIDTVIFLRPTESLTIFLQQLGRGLRHAPGKDCLTVIDLVGQMHQKYRIDRKFAALLPSRRFRIDRELAADFPHLPAGSSIILEKQARAHVLETIKRHYQNFQAAVTESIATFEAETGKELSFSNFITESGYEPHQLLQKKTWSQWKQKAGVDTDNVVEEPGSLRYGLTRTALSRSQTLLLGLSSLADKDVNFENFEESEKLRLHYHFRQKSGRQLGCESIEESLKMIRSHTSIISDLKEVGEWAGNEAQKSTSPIQPKIDGFELHGTFTSVDINVILGSASFESPGQTGLGVLHFKDKKVYALLMTFRKSENEFSPSTMYEDFPVNRTLIHWQSQNNTAQASMAGRHLTQHKELGYEILIFARTVKKEYGATLPFTFLGPANIVDFHGERPITCNWKLESPMPWELFEEGRVGG